MLLGVEIGRLLSFLLGNIDLRSFVGWDIGFEPMYAGVTVRCVNHFANPTTDGE